MLSLVSQQCDEVVFRRASNALTAASVFGWSYYNSGRSCTVYILFHNFLYLIRRRQKD